MTSFVAIDFETADAKRDSACAVGLVRVEGAEIVYRESALIRPPRGMSAMCQAVHGLSWDAVKDAPPFAQVWPKLAPILNGVRTMVAHNAPFDRSVLEACCAAAGVAPPKADWVCTLALARKRWTKPASHKLPDVCQYLGIPFANHHEAGADAEAAARVLIAMEGRRTATEVEPVSMPIKQVSQPSSEVGKILAAIPLERRTIEVANLMRDAERLGPKHAADLVGCVDRWLNRRIAGQPYCKCGRTCTLLCSLCRSCIEDYS